MLALDRLSAAVLSPLSASGSRGSHLASRLSRKPENVAVGELPAAGVVTKLQIAETAVSAAVET